MLDRLVGLLERVLRFRGVRRDRVTLPNGVVISYLRAGPRRGTSAKTLVLVHGLGTSNLSWARVIVRLAKRHRVIAPDLLGYGQTALRAGVTHATVTDQAEALELFLRSELFPDPVVLVGQSMGGWLSVKAARRVAPHVDQLVLVNSAGVYFEGLQGLRKFVSPSTRDEVYRFWAHMWYRVPAYIRPFWKGAAAHMRRDSVQRFLDTVQAADFVNEDLGLLEMPVSILWGQADRFMPIATVDVMAQALRSTRIHWIPRCGHIPALEASAEFVRILTAIANAPEDARPTPPSQVHPRAGKAAGSMARGGGAAPSSMAKPRPQ